MLKRKNVVIMLGIVLIMSLSVSLMAQHEMKGKMKGTEGWKMMCIDDLSDQQKQEIQKLKQAVQKETLSLKSKLQVKKAELNDLLMAENLDKNAIYKKIDEISEIEKKLKKKHIDTMIKVQALLTPEQRVKFKSRLMRHRGNFGAMRGHGFARKFKRKSMIMMKRK